MYYNVDSKGSMGEYKDVVRGGGSGGGRDSAWAKHCIVVAI